MAEPLVSILVPGHNAAGTLGDTLRSALAQTWPSLEIIIVDDGSTDQTSVVARSFASENCRLITQQNRGASAARNRALLDAQGDYVQYLDADDLLAPDKVALQMRRLLAGDDRWLTFGSVIHFFREPHEKGGVCHPARLRHAACADPVEFLTDLWSGDHPAGMVQTSQWLASRHLIEQAGPWDEKLSVDDDGEFFARVILAAHQVEPVPEALTYYRKYRKGPNLSRAGHRHGAFRRSALEASMAKSRYLLARSSTPGAARAAARLVTGEIIASHPAHPELVREGLTFLRTRHLPFSGQVEGSPWFLRIKRLLGWRTARTLQWYFWKWSSPHLSS